MLETTIYAPLAQPGHQAGPGNPGGSHRYADDLTEAQREQMERENLTCRVCGTSIPSCELCDSCASPHGAGATLEALVEQGDLGDTW